MAQTISRMKKISGQLVKVKIVSLHLYHHNSKAKLLTVLAVDEEGVTLECKTWRDPKNYTVMRKFTPGQTVLIRFYEDAVRVTPDYNYSRAKFVVYDDWYILEATGFDEESYLPCFTYINQFCRHKSKPATVVGVYRGHSIGPSKRDENGHFAAQGYFVDAVDASLRRFRMLVWHHFVKGRPVALDRCTTDTVIMLPFAREQDEDKRPKRPKVYTLTSVYPLVAKPMCIDPKKGDALRLAVADVDSDYYTDFNPWS